MRKVIGSSAVFLVFAGCELETPKSSDGVVPENQVAGFCTLDKFADAKTSLGQAWVFSIDPIQSSGGEVLLPSSLKLDEFRSLHHLNQLKGTGRLEGTHAEVRNGLFCSNGFGAFDSSQQYDYRRDDPRFAEVMSYAYAEYFRHEQIQANRVVPVETFEVIAHCMLQDNAYFMRWFDGKSDPHYEVCMGTSRTTQGASYSEDAHVLMHEMQHGVTAAAYDSTLSFNRFFYDEAGVLNEGISDFVALLFSYYKEGTGLSDRLFSRWALRLFDPNFYAHRGVDRCPEYARSAGGCRVPFVYPDGLGWPYANNYGARASLQSVFDQFSFKESIHHNSVIVSGALWDAAVAVDFDDRIYAWVVDTLKQMPLPTIQEPAPVSILRFFQTFYEQIQAAGIEAGRLERVRSALLDRGVLEATTLNGDWAEYSKTKLIWTDRPKSLRDWLLQRGYDPSVLPNKNETGLNRKPNRGEWAAVWFNFRNRDRVTAGNVKVRFTSLTPELKMLGPFLNDGYISENTAEIVYAKINGQQILETLHDVSMNDTYQGTVRNIELGAAQTAIWMEVSADAEPGTRLEYRLEVRAENAPLVVFHDFLEVE